MLLLLLLHSDPDDPLDCHHGPREALLPLLQQPAERQQHQCFLLQQLLQQLQQARMALLLRQQTQVQSMHPERPRLGRLLLLRELQQLLLGLLLLIEVPMLQQELFLQELKQ